MPAPANRVPVRIARGTKAALDAGLADLQEGEICYATDENALYVIEGGVLTVAGSDISAVSIGDLSDVDTTTSAPTDGQGLIWNNVDGEWQPGDSISDVVSDTTPQLGGNLDVNGNQIVSAGGGDIEIAPDTTGGLVVRGNNTDGKIKLNCTANTHGVTIQSPPHADAATYSLILPSGAGTAGQVLTSQGGAQLTWEDAASDGASSIDDLTDVDTSTTPPTTGQVLEWDGTNWVPSTQAAGGVTSIIAGSGISVDQATGDVTITATGGGGGGAVESVNSETGVVSLGVQDMDDFEFAQAANSVTFPSKVASFNSVGAYGEWAADAWGGAGGGFVVTWLSTSFGGGDLATKAEQISAGDTVTFLWPDASTSTETVAQLYQVNVVKGIVINDPHNSIFSGYANGTPLMITSAAITGGTDVPLADGDILQWNDADQKFNPAQLPAAPVIPVDSVNGETGAVSLGIQDMNDYEVLAAYPYNYDPVCCGVPNGAFSFTGNVLVINGRDSDGTSHVTYMTATQGQTISIWYQVGQTVTEIPGLAVAWLNSGVGTEIWRLEGTLPGDIASATGFFLDVAPDPLEDDDILQWDAASSKFRPAQLPDATTTRTLLGIGEYADDAAAGTGGVASGAMYYNTTSSDYRLKS